MNVDHSACASSGKAPKSERLVRRLQARIVKVTRAIPVDRPCSRGALQWLEPDEGKLSRPVLRGGGGRKAASLPDQWPVLLA